MTIRSYVQKSHQKFLKHVTTDKFFLKCNKQVSAILITPKYYVLNVYKNLTNSS